jgi:hypothetical protein
MGKTGAWLSVIPNSFDGMELLREGFQDNLAICYGLRPKAYSSAAMDAGSLSRLSMGSAARWVAL